MAFTYHLDLSNTPQLCLSHTDATGYEIFIVTEWPVATEGLISIDALSEARELTEPYLSAMEDYRRLQTAQAIPRELLMVERAYALMERELRFGGRPLRTYLLGVSPTDAAVQGTIGPCTLYKLSRHLGEQLKASQDMVCYHEDWKGAHRTVFSSYENASGAPSV